MTAQKRRQIFRCLERLRRQNGGELRPAQVVEAARDPDSPMHDQFTWDRAEAANRYNLIEARRLINSYKIPPAEHTQHRIAVPFYVHNPATRSGYRPIAEIKTDVEVSRDVLRSEMQRLIVQFGRAVAIATELDLAGELQLILDQVQKFHQIHLAVMPPRRGRNRSA